MVDGAASIAVRGDGIAARCCAHLLSSAGIAVAFASERRPRLSAIMVGAATQKLFADVFDTHDLFAGMRRIDRRVVSWGPGATPLSMPHFAAVVNENLLFERIPTVPAAASSSPLDWSIIASGSLPGIAIPQAVGSRVAFAVPVELRDPAASSTCWMESLPAGWLFLLPDSDQTAWLIGTKDVDECLRESRLVADQIGAQLAEATNFAAHPRIAWPLASEMWLACGTAALGFDPLCGDGSGHAVREGILAAAVVRAACRGEDRSALAAHYRTRLLAGFKRHLEQCVDFYSTGGTDVWWQAQTQALREGLVWCDLQLAQAPPFRYRLIDFDLHLIDNV